MTLIADLGDLPAPVLVFGGPYSNLQASEALFERAIELGITPDRIICTGDVCAYCADPRPTAELIRASGCAVVMGNCEESLGGRESDCGCGFEEGVACDLMAAQWFAHADRALTDELRGWMLRRPRFILFRVAGRRYAAIHGGVDEINRFHWPTATDAELAVEIVRLEAMAGPVDGVVAGHTGIPFARTVFDGDRQFLWLNAGAIGLPAHDGEPCTSFVTLGDTVSFHRLDYDHAAAAEAMRRAGLRSGYDRALECGWWPSEESFPAEMRKGMTSVMSA